MPDAPPHPPEPTKKQQLIEFIRCVVDAAKTGNQTLLLMAAANLNPVLESLPDDWTEPTPQDTPVLPPKPKKS